MAHAHAPHVLNCMLMDGSRLTLVRDVADRLVTTGFTASGARAVDAAGENGAVVLGFGPWPSWDANVRNGVDTEPDEDSGLFEPERLFVLREQYAFLTDPNRRVPLSLGPIDKLWWDGTEHVVQARQASSRH